MELLVIVTMLEGGVVNHMPRMGLPSPIILTLKFLPKVTSSRAGTRGHISLRPGPPKTFLLKK
jgi:hypothetical protein